MLPKILTLESVFQLELCKLLPHCYNDELFYSENQHSSRASPKAGTDLGAGAIAANTQHDPFFPRAHGRLRKLVYQARDLGSKMDYLGFGLVICQGARTVHGYPTSQGCWVIMSSLWRCLGTSVMDATP